MLPSLREATLDKASLTGVPTEILSRHPSDNCLDRLAAAGKFFEGCEPILQINHVAVGDITSSS
jgi:hypothetical protein